MTEELQVPVTQPNTETQPVKQGEGAGTGGGEPKFTQKDMDRVATERAAQAKQSAINDLLSDLGFENADALKSLVTAAKERADAEKTELQKAQEALAAEKAKTEAAVKQLADANAARRADKVDGRILALATSAKALYPQDVVTHLRNTQTDALNAAINDEGAVDDKAIGKLIEDVRKERAAWFGSTAPGSPSNAGGKLSGADDEEAKLRLFREMRRNV